MIDQASTEEAKEVLQWIQGENDGVRRINGMPRTDSEWFVVDNVWLKKWKKMAGLLQEEIEEGELGEIDNSNIIDLSDSFWKESGEKIIRSTLMLGVDYELLPPKAWNYFVRKYGVKDGSEIIRKSIEINDRETQVEITFKPIKSAILNGGRWEIDGTVTIFISHKTKIREIVQKFRRIMRERTGFFIDVDDLKL